MRVLNAIQRVILLLLLIPVVAIILDTILRAFDAREGNAIVDAVRSAANSFILAPFTDVFPDQSYLQTAAVALAGYGVITLLVVFLFRGLRSLVSARPAPKTPPPAPAPRSSAPPQTTATAPADAAESKKS